MMVDIDKETVFQSLQARALYAVTLQNDGRVAITINVGAMKDAFRVWQHFVDHRDTIAHDYLGALTHLAQDLGKGQRRAYGVAVRPRVRCNQKTPALFNLL